MATLLRWSGRIFSAILLLVLALVTFGWIRDSVVRHKYRQEFTAPGRLIDIGTHTLHVHCEGTGHTTVVFESDMDALESMSWARVHSEVAQFMRACTYDRAGILWSRPGPRPRDGEQISKELKQLLDASGEKGPCVMVGHAMGGALLRIFAGQYPESVAGLVFVDASHPDQLVRLSSIGGEVEIPKKGVRPLIFLFSHLGMPGRYQGRKYSTMTADAYDIEQAFLPVSSMAWFDERVEGPATLEQAALVENFDGLPLIILAASQPVSYTSLPEVRLTGDPHLLWLELQEELTSLSKNSEIRTYDDAGHYIQFGRLDVVIAAVRDMIRTISEGKEEHPIAETGS